MTTTTALSVILATDTWETILPVVERLRRQTAASRLELIFVTPAASSLEAGMGPLPEFGAVQVIEVPTLNPLAAARVVGVHAARASLVFIGETHSYAHPEWARYLIERAEAGPWGVVVPAFGNANPDGALSWAGLLGDYGGWAAGLPAREIDVVPMYNALYRRSVLLEFEDRLEPAISHGDEILVGLRARGHRAYFEPDARMDHVNVSRSYAWVHERYLCGALVGAVRASRWPWWRRLAYTLGAPLIPLVLLARTRSGIRETSRRVPLPRGTHAAVVVSAIVKAFGEMVGYAGLTPAAAEARMTEYELHKLAYTTGKRR